MRLAIPDLVSNSYFPAVAARTLGCFADEGLELEVVHVSPVDACARALAEGSVEFIGASAHVPLLAFTDWAGAKLVCAQSQGMYWFLVMRADLAVERGDLAALAGMRIAAVPFVGAALARVFAAAGIDPQAAGIEIFVPSDALGPGVNFGVAAARALEERRIDGFFANGMGAALAAARGIGRIVLDVRRGDGPRACFNFTQPAIATTDALIARAPELVAKVVRAIARTHAMLKRDAALAVVAAKGKFPPAESELIEALVRLDAPYYDQRLDPDFVSDMCQYAHQTGLLRDPRVPYADVVATRFERDWNQL